MRLITKLPPLISLGGFAPTQLPGCVHWLRADLGVTVLQTGLGVYDLLGLNDQSGTGDPNKNMVLTTPGSFPAYNPADPNFAFKPSISITAANSLKSGGVWSNQVPPPYTIFWVGSSSNGASTTIFQQQSAVIDIALQVTVTGTQYAVEINGTTSAGTTFAAITTPFIVMLNVGKAATQGSLNAMTQDTGAAVTANANFLGAKTFQLGATVSGYNGVVAEYIAFNRALTNGELYTVMHYLGTRYRVSIGA